MLLKKAKSISMPNDNIQRAIKKGSRFWRFKCIWAIELWDMDLVEWPIIIEILTDNRNRAASSVKALLDRSGGNLGVTGCVSYMLIEKVLLLLKRKTQLMKTH